MAPAPTQDQRHERELRRLVLSSSAPVALFIEETRGLRRKTLNGLKATWPSIMEEIAHRTDILSFEGLGEYARAYLAWLLAECTEADTDAGT